MLWMTVESALYQSESGICSSASTKGECLKCKQDIVSTVLFNKIKI